MLTRSILFLKGDYWIVRDSSHRARMSITLSVQFHFDSSHERYRQRASRIRIYDQVFRGWPTWVEEDAWVSHCYGQKEPCENFAFMRGFARPGPGNYQLFTAAKGRNRVESERN